MNTKNLAIVIITTLVAGGLGYFWLGEQSSEVVFSADSANLDTKAGAALYAQNCASCHGDRLQGQPEWKTPLADGTFPAPPHDQTGHTWHHDDALLFSYTKNGGMAALAAQGVSDFKSGMPGFGQTLSDQEIRNTLGFIKSTWPERIQKIRAERAASGG